MKSNLLRSPILVAALAVAGGLALIGRDALTAPRAAADAERSMAER